jgi:hypothetical protein
LDFAGYLALILSLSIAVTKVVDLVRNAVDPTASRVPKVVWNIVAFVVGIVFAVGWSVDVVNPGLALIPAFAGKVIGSTAAEVLSGFVLGGAAGFWHEWLSGMGQKATTPTR